MLPKLSFEVIARRLNRIGTKCVDMCDGVGITPAELNWAARQSQTRSVVPKYTIRRPDVFKGRQVGDLKEYLADGMQELIAGNGVVGGAKGYILSALAFLAFVLALIKRILKQVFEIVHEAKSKLYPLFYPPEKKTIVAKRRAMAEYLGDFVKAHNLSVEWTDANYTDLEVEVEIETSASLATRLITFGRDRGGLRREPFTKAVRSVHERRVVLQGDPGAGKSVSLRHLALRLSAVTSVSQNVNEIIPIYIDLKSFRPGSIPFATSELRLYIYERLSLTKASQAKKLFDPAFRDPGSQTNWLFLFDSFDEIPEILKASEGDATIAAYSSAIEAFMLEWRQCRAIVASRFFRGPKSLTWPRMTIAGLTTVQQMSLMERAGLTDDEIIKARSLVASDNSGVYSNPMVLALLCQYIANGGTNHSSLHMVYDDFVNRRLRKDTELLREVYKGTISDLRAFAEATAYCMSMDEALGLQPVTRNLVIALQNNGYPEMASRASEFMSALDKTRLGRLKVDNIDSKECYFSFPHRRIQEYFATCVVMNEGRQIDNYVLLLDARWREATVVLLQLGTAAKVTSLCESAYELLSVAFRKLVLNAEEFGVYGGWPWPRGALALMSLLQDGLAARPTFIEQRLRELCESILANGQGEGRILDRKWALETSGVASVKYKEQLFENAFRSDSEVLKESAYSQLGRLSELPAGIAAVLRGSLMRRFYKRELNSNRFEVEAGLARLRHPKQYLDIVSLLNCRLKIEYSCTFILAIAFCVAFGWRDWSYAIFSAMLCACFIVCSPVMLSGWDSSMALVPNTLMTRMFAIGLDRTPRLTDTAGKWMQLILVVSTTGFCLYFGLVRHWFLAFLTFVSLMLGLWVSATCWCVSQGRFTSGREWPLGIVAPIYAFRSRDKKRDAPYDRIKSFASTLGAGVLVILMLIILLTFVTASGPLQSVGLFVGAVLILTVQLSVVYYLLALTRRFFIRIRDLYQVRRFSAQTVIVTSSELEAFLLARVDPANAAAGLRSIRLTGRLEVTRQSWQVLRRWSAQSGGRTVNPSDKPLANENAKVAESPLVLDELARLEEDVISRLSSADTASLPFL